VSRRICCPRIRTSRARCGCARAAGPCAWKPADGLIVASEAARTALAAHHPAQRSFSPTALEHLAQCPYRFALRTILKLEPREEPEAIEALGPLERGSLIHDVQYELLAELREAGLLPLRSVDAVTDRLDRVLAAVAARYRDELYPAIERVWDDGIATIHADLREWLRRMTEDPEWLPQRFELAFGPVRRGARDPGSVDQPVALPSGLSLRGSIDLVERGAGNVLRATDYKTGAARILAGSVIAGGTSLQPTLYALVLEQLFRDAAVAGGRLYYCTSRGQFRVVEVPLDDEARAAERLVTETLRHHFDQGFFPAAPDKGACAWCDFRPICGPYEELRVKEKAAEPLAQLVKLRTAR
jgi:ATP-dependent helicase/nuclease subunit B